MRRFGIAALVIGMAIAITGSTVVAVAPGEIRVRTAMMMVALLLMAAGYLGVASEVSGWPRPVLRLVAGLQLVWLAWVIARPFLPPLDDWHYNVLALLWWSGIVLLAIAARAWWRPASPAVVVAAVLAVVLEALPWAPYLAPAFDAVVEDLPALEPWIRPLRELLTSGAILVLVRAIRPGAARQKR